MMSEGDAIIERMYECMDLFSEATNAWFKHAFNAPTEAQRLAWPAIRSGENVLVVAPTGSGKTLCAFLSAIDRLMTKEGDDLLRTSGGGDGTAESDCNAKKRKPVRGVKVLYISPLKALGVDVAKNLQAPLAGIAGQCEAMGLPSPKVSVGIRSGDTTPQERRRIVSHPPDILVTTPESLFLLLTSKARRILSAVDTVIVDEVHAIAGSKRGAHLALSLERLESLAGRSVQRIGLSATVEPPAEAARFLGGTRPVRVIRPESHPDMDLKVVEPLSAMRDPVSDDAGRRTGAVKLPNRHTTHISGVSPAMETLAERKGLTSVGGDEHTSRVSTGGSVWPAIERSVLDEVLKHHTTLVFVNSRGLAEKLTARLNDLYAQLRTSRKTGSETAVKADAGRDALSDRRLGRTDLSVSDNASQPESTASDSTQPYPDLGSPEGREGFAKHYDSVVGSTTMLVSSHADADAIAMAHHGSVSKDRRKQIEEQLKRGQLRCVVATSSLELGIDMGSVDLVIQIAPPLSVSSGLQRVGRADHKVGGVSHALFYPITREQIIGTAASIECMRSGDIETLTIPCNPLDVLAQQTVAAAAMDDLKPDDWYVTVRKAAPFEDLDRTMFDAVMGMMTGAYNGEDFSAFRPPLQYNEEAGLISARPGAQRLAVTSGGTIPDRGTYTVVLPEEGSGPGPRKVGELDEEMVYESRVGDVITLGTSTWQIQEITRDRVVVVPAPGRTARLPFWHGEGDGRDAAFGRSQGRFIRDMAQGLRAEVSDGIAGDKTSRFDTTTIARLRRDGLDDNAIGNLADLLAEQRAATGTIPNDRELVVERCQDEEGDWRVIVHSPYGRRVHEPWAMAITTRIKQRYGFDGQVYAADDGIMPQTEEHLAVLELLAIPTCVVALTKCDLVDGEWAAFMADEVRGRLAATPYANADVVPVSSRTGAGLDELRAAVQKAAHATARRATSSTLRLPVDRSFTIKGAGTVITGTLWSGIAAAGDEVEIMPAGTRTRIRSGKPVDAAAAGHRTALNLNAVSTEQVRPGDFLCTPGSVVPTDHFDVDLTYLGTPGNDKPLESGSRVHVAHGTKERIGRVLLMDGLPSIAPGQKATAQIRTEEDLPVSYGDRFVIRSYSPVHVVGGGVVLRAHPRRTTTINEGDKALLEALRSGDEAAAVQAAFAQAEYPVNAGEIAQATGLSAARAAKELAALVEAHNAQRISTGNTSAELFTTKRQLQKLSKAIENALLKFHAANPAATGIAKDALRQSVMPKASAEAFAAVLASAQASGQAVMCDGLLSQEAYHLE